MVEPEKEPSRNEINGKNWPEKKHDHNSSEGKRRVSPVMPWDKAKPE